MGKRAAAESFDEFQMNSILQKVKSVLAEASVCHE
jgi:hypothetical protein